MQTGKTIIVLLTAFLVVLGVLGFTWEETVENDHVPLTFSIQAEGCSETISCWENAEGDYIVFLPGYARMEQIVAHTEDKQLMLDGKRLPDNMACTDFRTDMAYPVEFSAGETTLKRTLTFVRSGNVASLYIDVASGSMDYIHMDKSNKEGGSLRLYDQNGQLTNESTIAAMNGRGDSSWEASKKPYNLTLSKDADLMGMGAAQRWILISEGTNSVNIRNKIVYDFAHELGIQYTPNCNWVDLYLNGEYAGLYLLIERNEIHPQRVDIPLEGSFLISMEAQQYLIDQNIPHINMGVKQVIRLRHTEMDMQEIAEIWQTLKNALLSSDGMDPETGKHWQELIDMESWARKYLIEEVFANPDGGFASQFFYMSSADTQKKIYAGPLWDYDYTMGGEDFWMKNYTSFLTVNRVHEEGQFVFWFYELYHKDAFYQKLTELYEEEFLPKLKELVEYKLDGYTEQISSAMLCDGIRWGWSKEDIWNDLQFIKKFMENRIVFLTDLWINKTSYHMLRVYPGRYSPGYFAVKAGESLPPLPDYEEVGGLGWYNAATGEPFDITQPIYEDVSIYVKKPEDTLPVIHVLPMLTLVLALPLLAVLDRVRAGRREKEKCPSPIQ